MLTRRRFLGFGVAALAAVAIPAAATRQAEAKGLGLLDAPRADTHGDGALQAVGHRVRRRGFGHAGRRHRRFGFNRFRRRSFGKPGFGRRRIFRTHRFYPQSSYGGLHRGHGFQFDRAKRFRRLR